MTLGHKLYSFLLLANTAFSQQVDWVNNIKNKPVFDVRQYGADSTGVKSSTAACNAAATAAASAKHGVVLFPSGTYKMTDACIGTGTITFMGPGVLLVPPSFNLSAIGVIVLMYAQDTDCTATSGLCPGSPKVDLHIRFQNTDTAIYGSLIAFPPAIACGDFYGCSYANIDATITQAMTGIQIKPTNFPASWNGSTTYTLGEFVQSAGQTWRSLQVTNFNHTPASSPSWWTYVPVGVGVHLGQIKVSAFDFGVILDGSDSEMTMDNYHCFPWDTTANQGAIYPLHGTCLYAAALYELNISQFTASNFWRSMSITYDGAIRTQCPDVNIGAYIVDTYGGTDVSCGNLNVGSATVKMADTPTTAYYFLNLYSTGSAFISNMQFTHVPDPTTVQVYKITNSGGRLQIVNSNFYMAVNGQASKALVFNGAGGTMTFNGNQIFLSGAGFNFASGAPLFAQAGSSSVFTNNFFSPIGTSSNGGIYFEPLADSLGNWVSSNVMNGWPLTKPTYQSLGIYQTEGVICPTLSALGTPANGRMSCCLDCKNYVDDSVTVGANCVSGGHGATATRINGTWRCY